VKVVKINFRFILVFIGFLTLLFWKYIRLVFINEVPYYLHTYIISLLFLLSIIIFIRRYNLFYFDSNSQFILLIIVIGLLRPFLTNFDPVFFLSTVLITGCYYLCVYEFSKYDESQFSKFYFSILAIGAIISFIDFFDASYIPLFNIIDYNKINTLFNTGIQTQQDFDVHADSIISGLTGIRSFRAGGIGGSPYVTGGFVSGFLMLTVIEKRKTIFFISLFVFILLSVTSAMVGFFAALIIYIIINSKKHKIYSILLILITLPILIQMWNLRGGVLSNPGYHNISMAEQNSLELIFNFLLGEGTHSENSLSSEFRILGLTYSYGLICFISAFTIIYNCSIESNRYDKITGFYTSRYLYTILPIFITSFHYNTILIFPNFVIVVIVLAYISSRKYYNISRQLI